MTELAKTKEEIIALSEKQAIEAEEKYKSMKIDILKRCLENYKKQFPGVLIQIDEINQCYIIGGENFYIEGDPSTQRSPMYYLHFIGRGEGTRIVRNVNELAILFKDLLS